MAKCICGKIVKSNSYCSLECQKEKQSLYKAAMALKPKGYLQTHANNVLSKRWEILWRLSPTTRDLMYKIERKLPLCISNEEH